MENKLAQKAIEIWDEYGKKVSRIWFNSEQNLLYSEPLIRVISSGDENNLKSFIQFYQQEISNLQD